ncbi:MAG: hypothetical protein UV79_C0020G0001, partial [candidate division TM6 bacterium GW2011_GWF2_43_17]
MREFLDILGRGTLILSDRIGSFTMFMGK